MASPLTKQLGFLIFFSCIFFSLQAQDGHYWTEHFGSRSMLLNGVVIGSGSDLGMVYYNPGRLATVDNPSFLLSAQVYELFRFKIEDGLGNNQDLKDTKFSGAPNLVAGTFNIPQFGKHKFAYSFLTRHREDTDFFLLAEEQADVIDNLPGEEDFVGKLRWVNQTRDEWLGLTWSYPISEVLGIGVSTFVSARRSDNFLDLNLSALSADDKVALMLRNREIYYSTYGILWKAGLSLNLEAVSFGLTVTTPKINILGNGSVIYQDILTGIDTSGNGEDEEVYIFSRQDKIKAQHKSPWSIGLGLGIPIGRSKIHLSSAWYSNISKYALMETAPFIGQSNGQEYSFSLVDELEHVINAGIGGEVYINPNISAYASFATDFSAVTKDASRSLEFRSESHNSTLTADLYHMGLGVSLNLKRWELTAGTSRARAKESVRRPINFPDDGDEPIFESEEVATIRYDRWRFIFAFSFSFSKKNTEESP